MATIAEKSRTKEIIDRLQAIINNASPVPLASGKVTIYKDEMQSLLIELASQMEIELKTYHEVNDRKGKIINEAKKEAEKIIFQAEHTASRMRVNKRVTNVPPIDYDMLTEEERSALGNANEIYGASLIYTDEMLTEVNNLISDMYQNIRSDYEIILQTLEEKMNIVAANRAELMDGLQEMDTDDRSQQILEIGQLLSNELFNARMKGRVNPDEYDDGSIQLSLDLQEEQEEKARLAEEKAQMAEAALAQMRAERDALMETVTKMKQEGVGAALRSARTAPVRTMEMAGKAASLTGGVSSVAAGMEKSVFPGEGMSQMTGTVPDKDKVREQQDDDEYEIVYVTEDELEEGEEYEIEYVEEDELEEGEEYETVYVEEDELEEGEEYETVYVEEEELEDSEEYEIEYVNEDASEEAGEQETVYQDKEESEEDKEHEDEPAEENEANDDFKPADYKQTASEQKEVKEAIRELEAMENESKEIPLIPHFKKSEKIASVPSERIAKMATAITTEKKYSGLISRAVAEREKTEAAVTVEETNSIPIQSKAGKKAEKTKVLIEHKKDFAGQKQDTKKGSESAKDKDIKTDKEGNEYVQATMKFDEDFEIMEF
ncbi:MAG: hypothetical protein K2J90_15285 [Lachnospiraceae bacterium]|nr:hypothetical protein [Lachnospiraceae bacterium]